MADWGRKTTEKGKGEENGVEKEKGKEDKREKEEKEDKREKEEKEDKREKEDKEDKEEKEDKKDKEEKEDKEESGRSFTFRLPPIRLPSLVPGDLELYLPVPRYRREWSGSAPWVLLVAFGFDVFDAALALSIGGAGPVGLARVLGGLVLSLVVAGRLGTVYLWEVIPVIAGVPWLGVMPTLTAVVIAGDR